MLLIWMPLDQVFLSQSSCLSTSTVCMTSTSTGFFLSQNMPTNKQKKQKKTAAHAIPASTHLHALQLIGVVGSPRNGGTPHLPNRESHLLSLPLVIAPILLGEKREGALFLRAVGHHKQKQFGIILFLLAFKRYLPGSTEARNYARKASQLLTTRKHEPDSTFMRAPIGSQSTLIDRCHICY